jgi:hypothetical protein
MVESGGKFGNPRSDEVDSEFETGLEQELRAGLRPRSAPEGFADRVLARVEKLSKREPRPSPMRWLRNPAVTGAIAALLLLAIGLGGYFEHQRERQIAGEHARQQVLLALRITGATLQDVRNKLDKN